MTIKMISGLHLTAHDKKCIQWGFDNNSLSIVSKRKKVYLKLLDNGLYNVIIKTNESDDWGNTSERIFEYVVSIA